MTIRTNGVPRMLTYATLLMAFLAPAAESGQVAMAAANRKLGRGVNILGYDPIWRSFEQRRFKVQHFQLIKQGGFNSVRINLHPFAHMDSAADNVLSRSWLTVLDWAVHEAVKNDLMVILDLHEFTAMGKDPRGNYAKFLDFWRQIAPRYREASENCVRATQRTLP